MAVEYLLDEEDEENGQPISGMSQQIAGAPALPTGNQPSDNPGTSSGSYTNLQKYIEANKGRDFGGDFANKIEAGTQEGLNQLNQREGEFKSSVDQGTLKPLDTGLQQKITSAPQTLSQEEKETAKNLRTGKYSGLEDFGGGVNDPYAELRQYFGGLEEQKKSLESSSGSKGLLEKYYNRPTYTEGEKALDSYILGGQMAPVNKAKENLGSAIDKYGKKREELNAYAGQAKSQSESAQDQYRKLLGLDASGSSLPYSRGSEQGLIQKDISRLQSKAEAKQSDKEARLSAARAAGKDLRQQGADLYQNFGGLDRLYGVDPKSYLTGKDANYQNVATPDDLARFQALSELAGADQTYLDPNLVGTLDDEASYGFELDRFMKDVDQKRSVYEAELRNPTRPIIQDFRNGNSPLFQYGNNLEEIINNPSLLANYESFKNNPVPYMRQIHVDPYQALLDEREKLRNQYGYYDTVTR